MTLLLRTLSSPWNYKYVMLVASIISMACLLFLLLAVSYILASNATGIHEAYCLYVYVCEYLFHDQ